MEIEIDMSQQREQRQAAVAQARATAKKNFGQLAQATLLRHGAAEEPQAQRKKIAAQTCWDQPELPFGPADMVTNNEWVHKSGLRMIEPVPPIAEEEDAMGRQASRRDFKEHEEAVAFGEVMDRIYEVLFQHGGSMTQ